MVKKDYTTRDSKLESEKVIIESPISFTGATKRIWPAIMGKEYNNKYIRWVVMFPLTAFVLYVAYVVILMWYVVFGLLLIPFRLLRRSHRMKKRQELQHRELLQKMSDS